MSAVGRITKACSSTWGDNEPHPQYDTPCHYEMAPTFRQWVCHCKTQLCQFVDYHEVKAFKYRIQDKK